MLDLCRLNKVALSLHLAPVVIAVGGGCTWAAVDAELQPHSLAVPAGVCYCRRFPAVFAFVQRGVCSCRMQASSATPVSAVWLLEEAWVSRRGSLA